MRNTQMWHITINVTILVKKYMHQWIQGEVV